MSNLLDNLFEQENVFIKFIITLVIYEHFIKARFCTIYGNKIFMN